MKPRERRAACPRVSRSARRWPLSLWGFFYEPDDMNGKFRSHLSNMTSVFIRGKQDSIDMS